MSDQTPTPEQIAAQALIDAADAWAADPDAVGDNDRDARNWLRERAEALTNPQPALPTEPGVVVRDALRAIWVCQTDETWRHGATGEVWSQVQLLAYKERAPFTRLVPERPPIRSEQMDAAVKIANRQHDVNDRPRQVWVDSFAAALANGTDR